MAKYSMTDEIKSSVELVEGAVLPRARVAPCSDRLPPTVEMQPLPASIAHEEVEEKSPAQWAYERLILYIKNFEDRLDNKHEVAMGLVGGEAGVLRIEGIGYFAPDIVTFYGRDEEGSRMQLIQHVAQLNVVLRATPKAPEIEEPRRIGFRLVSEMSAAAAPKTKAKTPTKAKPAKAGKPKAKTAATK